MLECLVKKLFKRVSMLHKMCYLKTATKKRAKQALGLPSQDSPLSGAGKKRYKKESTTKKAKVTKANGTALDAETKVGP